MNSHACSWIFLLSSWLTNSWIGHKFPPSDPSMALFESSLLTRSGSILPRICSILDRLGHSFHHEFKMLALEATLLDPSCELLINPNCEPESKILAKSSKNTGANESSGLVFLEVWNIGVYQENEAWAQINWNVRTETNSRNFWGWRRICRLKNIKHLVIKHLLGKGYNLGQCVASVRFS